MVWFTVADEVHRPPLGPGLRRDRHPDCRRPPGPGTAPTEQNRTFTSTAPVARCIDTRRVIAARTNGEAAFAPVAQLVELGQSTGELAAGDFHRIGTVLFATLHGTATLANNKMIDPLEDELIVYAIDSLLNGLAPQGHSTTVS